MIRYSACDATFSQVQWQSAEPWTLSAGIQGRYWA